MNKKYILCVLLCSINAFGMEENEIKLIKPDSFNDKGRLFIEHSVRLWHEAATQSGIHTGLAAIYNDIPANKPGIEALIYDAQSLNYANECNSDLSKYTSIETIADLIGINEAEEFNQDVKRSIAQMIVYKKISKLSELVLPVSDLGFSCVSMEPEILGKVLKANKDLNLENYRGKDNKYAARGILLMMGYFMQDHIIDKKFRIKREFKR